MATAAPAAGPRVVPKLPPLQPAAQPVPKPAANPDTPPARAPKPPSETTPHSKKAAPLRARHYGVILTLFLFVLLPTALYTAYLWMVAEDQYSSTIGFSVRREEATPMDFLGGLTRIAGSPTSDADILYDFILSQEMVRLVDARVDLRRIYSEAWPNDPLFAYDPSGTIEDLHKQWLSMMKVYYDSASGLITLESRAFNPVAAMAVASATFDQASTMINALSDDAQADATRYTAAELAAAFARLKTAREALTTFRMRTQIVDITSDIQSQMGILTRLQDQLATTMVDSDILRETTRANDPRLSQADQRIRVIEARIAAERAKFGIGGHGPGGEDYATVAAAFEGLAVDLEFAQQTYGIALAAHDAAKAAAQRQSRYLAPHIRPTLAEQSLYPHRFVFTGMAFFFLLAIWAIGVLIYYSVRDRR